MRKTDKAIRIVLIGMMDVGVVAALVGARIALVGLGFGTTALMYLIVAAIIALAIRAVVRRATVGDGNEAQRLTDAICANLISSLCVALFAVGEFYDTRVLFEAFPALEALGPYAPAILLLASAAVAVGVLALMRIYRDVEPSAEVSDKDTISPEGALQPSSGPTEGRADSGALAGGAEGRDSGDAMTRAEGVAGGAGGNSPSPRGRFWAMVGIVMLATAVLAVSVWLCASSEVLASMVDPSNMTVDAVFELIGNIVLVAVSILFSVSVLIAAVTLAVKGFSQLVGHPVKASATGEDAVAALFSMGLFVAALVLVRSMDVPLTIEGLLGRIVEDNAVVAVVGFALLLLVSTLAVSLVYAVLHHARVRGNSFERVARAIANALTFYVALLFSQVLKYLFFLPDFLSLLLEGVPDVSDGGENGGGPGEQAQERGRGKEGKR